MQKLINIRQLLKARTGRFRDTLTSPRTLTKTKTESTATASSQPKLPSNTTIEIKLAVPQLPNLSATVTPLISRLRSHDKRKRVLLAGSLSLVVISGIISFNALQNSRPSSNATATNANPLDRLERGTPDYPTVLPTGQTAEQLGGWTRISPPDRNPVFAYIDKIGDVPISVSQQPLPDEFKQDTAGSIQSMAYGFSATEKLTVKQNTLYIGSSSGGPQSVVMEKKGLLILMKSTAPIESKKWGDYAASLR